MEESIPQNSSPVDQVRTQDGGSAAGIAKIYYSIEIKSVATGDRVRLTKNQHEMMRVVSEDVNFVHPVIVILDLEGLPDSVDVGVDVYEDSV